MSKAKDIKKGAREKVRVIQERRDHNKEILQ